jgi:hypothetical protein
VQARSSRSAEDGERAEGAARETTRRVREGAAGRSCGGADGAARQQTLFDRAFGRIANKLTAGLQAKYAAATPEEQARDAFQAQLDAARNAAELGSAKNDLSPRSWPATRSRVQQAQARLDDIQNQQKLSDLQAAADKSRAIRNAEGDEALANLNDWLGGSEDGA